MVKEFNLGLLFSVVLFFALQASLHKPAVLNRTDYNAPPIEIKYLVAGFSVQASDSFWLRAIQDMDHCDDSLNERECKGKSWLYNIINLTVELDRSFKEAYYFGALALTILISDYEGASVIFDKGVDMFDTDWPLLYAAGYHALFEEKDKLKASQLYFKAAENGAPAWVRVLAGRLASEGGDNIRAKEILEQLIKIESDPQWIEKLKKKIDDTPTSRQ